MTNYVVYDVFTDHPFGGNQLAVFPDASALPADQLQAIAAEFNFSEVTFVFPPENPNHSAKVRIFTPTLEIPFAGHPTIGTAIALHDLGFGDTLILELGVGPLPCDIQNGVASFTTSATFERLATPDIDLVARALGLEPRQIKTTTHPPTQASLGLPFTITELESRDSLKTCDPNLAAFKEGARAHPATIDFAQFAYVRNGRDVWARMFAPLDSIPEDPATGSACATLAALLFDLGINGTLHITQGVEMGRPSFITAQASQGAVKISGRAVQTMKGVFLA